MIVRRRVVDALCFILAFEQRFGSDTSADKIHDTRYAQTQVVGADLIKSRFLFKIAPKRDGRGAFIRNTCPV